MYQVSESSKKQFEKMLGLAAVREGLEFIERDQERTIADQKKLVVIEAPTFHEEKRAAFVAERFKELGLLEVHIDRGGNVTGVRKGSGNGPRVLVEGHLDTVFPFGTVSGVTEKDGYLYAPGIGDDTRALAMIFGILRALNETGIRTAGDLVFTATTREEGAGSLGGMKDFLADHQDIDISLSIDNNDMSMLIFEATCGETWEVVFKGIGGHAFGAFGKMAQPIHAAARAVAKIAEFTVPEDPKTSFCVSNFHGGTDAGVHAIAPAASIKFNFRSNSREELEKLKEKIFKAIAEGAEEESDKWQKDRITWEKRQLGEVPGGFQSPNLPLVEAAYLGLRSLDIEPVFGRGGCTNANVAISRNIPALCMGRAFAPDQESKEIKNHSINERFPIKEAYKAVQQVFMVLLMAAGIQGEFDSVMK
ncbi:M20/M25/M40 family metallo-hydrolase [Lacrimispora sp.]|uniref:M20/M25/M40 family metallo-hydrolase n=1 Tax=Lacrimispora sp. TaxID=2719234 RepID=UPI002896F347|nr:M20/M25/M40 family metallo-hydrolase [Lacrimispora sp.]